MGSSLKHSLANAFSNNRKLNKKALQIKKSWDEVANLIHADKVGKKKK